MILDRMTRVMTFGTFDGIHDGHRHLFAEAGELGDELLVVVARDEHVLELKGHIPERLLDERMELVSYESEVSQVIAGDEELGTYRVVREHRPDIIVIGHDQDDLLRDLESWLEDEGTTIVFHKASPFSPEVFSTSILSDMIPDEVL